MRGIKSALCFGMAFVSACAERSTPLQDEDRVEPPLLATQVVASMEVPALGPPGEALIDSAGRIVLSFPAAGMIGIFDESGGQVSLLGGRGEGPGEFGDLSSIALYGDTLIVASDNARGQLSVFRLDGVIQSSRVWRSQPERSGRMTLLPTVPQRVTSDETGLVEPGVAVLATDLSRPGVMTDELSVPVLHVDKDGATVDTTLVVFTRASSLGVRGSGGAVYHALEPFPHRPLVGLYPDGRGAVVVTHAPPGRSFNVRAVAPDGVVMFDRDVPFSPVPIDADAVTEVARRATIFPGPPTEEEAIIRSRLPGDWQASGLVPEHLLPFTQMALGLDGTTWIAREATAEPDRDWLVLDEEGRNVGTVRLPLSRTILGARAGRFVVGVSTPAADSIFLLELRTAGN